jgi:putative transposase
MGNSATRRTRPQRRQSAAPATPSSVKSQLSRIRFSSDRGAQYTSSDFAAYCKKNKIRRSLGRTGICYDNAVSESFFATYKKELIHTRSWPTTADLKSHTKDWIENYYNTIRRHSTLGYLTPTEYELGYREISQLAA